MMEFKKTEEELLHDDAYWPVYSGESFDIWVPDTKKYYAWAEHVKVADWLQQKRENSARRRSDGPHSEFPTEYLRDKHTLACYKPRIAIRSITHATNRRTIISCLVPGKVFLSNLAPYFLWPSGDEKDQAFLVGVLSSIPLDWFARRHLESGLNFFLLNSMPIPRPDRNNPLWNRVVYLSGRLASPDERFSEWAKAVEVPFGGMSDKEKNDLIYELDAVVALLYQLNDQELIHIFKTFHEGLDMETRMFEVIKHHRSWTEKLKSNRKKKK